MAKTEISLTGNFSVEMNSEKTEAFLEFSSGTSIDKIWSIGDILGLFRALKIQEVKIDDLTKLVATASSKKAQTFRVSAVKSLGPTAPSPEILHLEEIDTPDHLKEAIEKTLAHAASPELYHEIQQKIERETTVLKKGPLPFLPEKTEKIKIIEKESRQERVYIDPTILTFCFVTANQKIGVISAAKLGTPGKNLCGETIPAVQLADPLFYPGMHITRKGNELSAASTGILRVGNNWADIIPFSEHSWALSQSEDKATCFLDFKPGSRILPIVPAKHILDAAFKLDYKPEDLLTELEIGTLIAEAIELNHPIEHRSISQAQDAYIDIIVSDDNLKAVLNVTKGSGNGKPLILKELGKAINESGFKFNKEKIKADIPLWFNGPEKSLIGYVLADGKPPQEAPKQTATYSTTFIEGKEYNQLRSLFSTLELPEAKSFPKDCITGIAKIEKEQLVLTLGPRVLGAPGSDVYGKAIPGKMGEPFSIQLFGNLELVGTNLVVAKKTGLLLKAEKDNKTFLAGFEHLDGEIQIDLADNNMTAYIAINAHRGTGKALNRADILAAIAKAGVVKGIENEILEKIIAASENEKDTNRLCFARGQAPTSGKPSEVKYLINFASGQNVTMRKDGTADFRNQDKITTIKKDTAIAEIFPNTHTSEVGWDVCGKEISASATPVLAVEIGQNIRQQVQEDGKILLIADQDGELRKDKNRLEIVATYTIKGNVDASTGNIKFPGTVQIAGDIMTGFYIVSGGEIKIAGSVEGSLLSADQDILIQNGVKGVGKAVLRTKGNIVAGFIEHATVLAVGDIKIKKTLLRSRIKCNGKLLMPDDAQIMGGQIKVKLGLVTGNLGSSSGTKTHVFFGQDILVEDQIEVEEKEISKLQEDLAKLNTAMKSSEKLNNKDQLQELFNEKVKSMKILEKRNLRIFTLKERFEQHFESELIIKGTIYPGVIVESHGRTHEISKLAKGIRIRFDTSSGRIIEEPISKST